MDKIFIIFIILINKIKIVYFSLIIILMTRFVKIKHKHRIIINKINYKIKKPIPIQKIGKIKLTTMIQHLHLKF
jgi:hypothetical protein